MTIQERQILNVTLIHLGGRITRPDDANLLRDTLQRLIGQGRTNLVLDCQEVPYIDSEALAIVIRTHTTLGRRGGHLKKVNISTVVPYRAAIPIAPSGNTTNAKAAAGWDASSWEQCFYFSRPSTFSLLVQRTGSSSTFPPHFHFSRRSTHPWLLFANVPRPSQTRFSGTRTSGAAAFQ